MNQITQKKKIPSDWDFKKLEDLVIIRKGKKQEPIFNHKVADSVPHILVESFDGNYKKYTISKKGQICNKNDILIIWDGSRFGLVATNLEGYVGSTIGIISSKGIVEKDYLFYFLKLNYEKIRMRRKGSGIPHIDKTYFSSLTIAYPKNKNEQKQIIAKLDSQVAQIELLKKEAQNEIVAIQELASSISKEIFSKYEIGHGE